MAIFHEIEAHTSMKLSDKSKHKDLNSVLSRLIWRKIVEMGINIPHLQLNQFSEDNNILRLIAINQTHNLSKLGLVMYRTTNNFDLFGFRIATTDAIIEEQKQLTKTFHVPQSRIAPTSVEYNGNQILKIFIIDRNPILQDSHGLFHKIETGVFLPGFERYTTSWQFSEEEAEAIGKFLYDLVNELYKIEQSLIPEQDDTSTDD